MRAVREILSGSPLLWFPVESCARDIVMLSSPLVSSGELCERYCHALFSSGFQWRAVREILSGSLLLSCPVGSCARDIVMLSSPLVSSGEQCERYCQALFPSGVQWRAVREILFGSLPFWCPVESCARDIVWLSSPLVSSGEQCERFCQAFFSSGVQWRAVREILSCSLLLWCLVESCARDFVMLSSPLVSSGELCERYCHAIFLSGV